MKVFPDQDDQQACGAQLIESVQARGSSSRGPCGALNVSRSRAAHLGRLPIPPLWCTSARQRCDSLSTTKPVHNRPEDPRKIGGQELEMAVGARVICNGFVAELEFARGTANEIMRVHVCFDGAGRKFLEEHPNEVGAIPISRMTLRYAALQPKMAYKSSHSPLFEQ
eukprot:6485380-Amphidinium_carterae.1